MLLQLITLGDSWFGGFSWSVFFIFYKLPIQSGRGPFCVKLAGSPWVCMDSLRVLHLLPDVQKHATGEFKLTLSVSGNGCLSPCCPCPGCLGVTLPSLCHSWEGLQETPATLSDAGSKYSKLMDWRFMQLHFKSSQKSCKVTSSSYLFLLAFVLSLLQL